MGEVVTNDYSSMFVFACSWLEVKGRTALLPLGSRFSDSHNMARLLLLSMLTVALPAGASEGPEACATAWVQCGGTGWSGPTCCDSGFSCSQMNSWYSQCVPKGSIAEKPEPVDMASADDECYHMFSELSFNTLVQSFPSNPDSEATAYVDCKLCSRSGMQCTANVLGGRTQLVASHIHLASDGDGENGAGPPVINFCGDNGPGMIADGSSYKTLGLPAVPFCPFHVGFYVLRNRAI